MTVATKTAVKKPAVKKAPVKKASVKKATVLKTSDESEATVAAKKPAAKAKALSTKDLLAIAQQSGLGPSAKTPKPSAKRPRKTSAVEQNETQEHARLAAKYSLEKKAENVRILDLRQVTTMTDFFVIASADSDKQVKAIAENVIAQMRDTEGVAPWHSEGWDTLRWVIVDFVDFVVHIFQKEARVLYNLERLWADAPVEEIKDEPLKKVTRAKRVKKEDAEEPKAKPIIRVIHDVA